MTMNRHYTLPLRLLLAVALVLSATQRLSAQVMNEIDTDGNISQTDNTNRNKFGRSDSIQSQHKEIPRGLHVWTIDEYFGDRTPAQPDTVSHMYMNSIFTTGMRGEYNTLGNLGTPRIERIFIDRTPHTDFIFTDPYTYFYKPVSEFQFTNTLSPITNLSYNTCGNRTNGEDHLKALFAVNAGKRLGVGMLFDYLYGRGYYSNQSTSLFSFKLYGSYLGDRYQAHLLFSTNHQKVAENGGLANDDYIRHPESFNESFNEDEIPTALSQNWNRNDHQHVFFNHRYSLGFSKKVPMTEDEIKARKFAIKARKEKEAAEAKRKARERAERNGEEFDEEEYDKEVRLSGRPDNARIAGDVSAANKPQPTDSTRIIVDNAAVRDSLLAAENKVKEDTTWMKDEYVPVTSFIHTVAFDNHRRIYQAYETPENYYLNQYYDNLELTGDSIYDKTRFWQLRNTAAVALLEGFNKWAKAGLKAFANHYLIHYSLPNTEGGYTSYNEQTLYVGGQLSKTAGRTLHYNAYAEFGVAGANAGEVYVGGTADVNFPLLGDTVQLAAKAFFHNQKAPLYMAKYHSRHFWWENELSSTIHTRIEGLFSLKRTRTQLRVAADVLKNYTYFGQSCDVVMNDNKWTLQNNALAVRQEGSPINVLTLQLRQDFTLGILNWENEITFQNSSNKDVLPLPALNIYSNLYIRFKIAKVLKCDLGADVRWFTKCNGMGYSPAIGQFTVIESDSYKAKVGGYPIVNAYANFHLKNTRFFVMMSHLNASHGGNYFLTAHYPLNPRILRFGLSWNFFN